MALEPTTSFFQTFNYTNIYRWVFRFRTLSDIYDGAFFAKIVDSFWPLTIFAKNSIKIFGKVLLNTLCYSSLHYYNVLNVLIVASRKDIIAINIGVNTTLPWYLKQKDIIGQIFDVYLQKKINFILHVVHKMIHF